MVSRQDVREFIDTLTLIAEHNPINAYIYRGEARCHERVSSGLFRQLHEIDNDLFDIAEAQKRQLDMARPFTKFTTDAPEILLETQLRNGEPSLLDFTPEDLNILAEIQHRGGKTNLIDFTTDLNIALFFACNYSPDQDGRIIFFRNVAGENYAIHRAVEPSNMADVQKSIFVTPKNGYIKEEDMLIFEVPSRLKAAIVEHLRKVYGLEPSSVYNDISGFIRDQHLYPDVEADFYAAQEYSKAGNYDKAIEYYTRCLNTRDISLRLALLYYLRGMAFYRSGRKAEALCDFQVFDLRQSDGKPELPAEIKEWVYETYLAERDEAVRGRGLTAINDTVRVYEVHRIRFEARDPDGNLVDGVRFMLLTESGYSLTFDRLIRDEGHPVDLPWGCHVDKGWFWFKKDGYRSVNGMPVDKLGRSFTATLKPLESNPGAPEITITATYEITEMAE